MILISRTYEIVTHESAEDGEVAEHGFLSEDEPCTFREIVEAMRGYSHPSCSHGTGDTAEWFSTEAEQDMLDGSYRIESLHYSMNNSPKSAKYWRWAAIAAGHVKVRRI